jgi:hypothetical protein
MTGDSVSLTALAGAQGGVLLTVQALEGGWPRRCLNRRLREESWTPIHRGAWAEPGREVNVEARLRAVQLQRPEWVVSHRARWASGPFHLGPDGWRTAHSVHPLVLGPENIPVIKDPERASQDVALAAFSAITHGKNPDVAVILEALASALGSADSESAEYFTELLEIGLGDTPARTIWRSLMSVGTFFPGRGTIVEESYLKGVEEGREEGRAEERSQMVLRVLEKRQIPTLASTRERITACADAAVLTRWLDRAFTVTDAEDLFSQD